MMYGGTWMMGPGLSLQNPALFGSMGSNMAIVGGMGSMGMMHPNVGGGAMTVNMGMGMGQMGPMGMAMVPLLPLSSTTSETPRMVPLRPKPERASPGKGL